MGIVASELLKCLEIREVKSLLDHEQVISPNLKRLKESMLNIGHLVDPLVVDKKTGVVLDGNHRLKVLEIIECPYAVCQTVDYMSSEIKVGTWYPTMDNSVSEQLFKIDSIKHEKVDYEAGKKAVDALKAPFMLMTKKDCYLLNPGKYKLMEMVEEQNFILSNLDKNSLDYVPEEESQNMLGLDQVILLRRAYTKDEIVKTAKSHTPMPPKSTRHLIPGRIIRLNMKLGWLTGSPEEARLHLEEMLKSRIYSGNVRKYYEPVIVIY